jgi:hypothetical protein
MILILIPVLMILILIPVLMILILIPVCKFNCHFLLVCFGTQKLSSISFVLHCGLLGFIQFQHTPTLLTVFTG